MPTQIYDAIIVGGGPAGASTAFYLGQAGKQVLVLEKEFFPRYKTCGGAVSRRVLEQFPFSFDPVIQSNASAISYVLGEKMITIPLKDYSSLCMVMRDEFDEYLLGHVQAEVRHGAAAKTVQENEETVAVETAQGERFESRYLVAADGANSMIARAMNLRRKKIMAGAIAIEALVSQKTLMRFSGNPILIFGEVDIGYLWIFPKADHLSVGIGALKPRPGELQAVLRRVMERFEVSIRDQTWSGHPLPIYGKREAIATRRTLLVGDAAGLVDPFTGEGIRFAIKSGRLAAEAILANRSEQYSASIEREIGRNHRLGAALTGLFYRLPRPSFEFALRNPVLSHALIDMVSDRIGYMKLLLKIAATFPLFAMTKKKRLSDLIFRA